MPALNPLLIATLVFGLLSVIALLAVIVVMGLFIRLQGD